MRNFGVIRAPLGLFMITIITWWIPFTVAFQPIHSSQVSSIRGNSYTGTKDASLSLAEKREEESSSSSSSSSSSPPRESEMKDLMGLFSPDPKCDTTRMSGTDLAYIGDVVFEIYSRSRYVWPSKRTSELQKTVVERVRAENQSRLLICIKEEFKLTEKEQQIVSRGRNAVTRSRNNRRDPATYQDSTAFEALVGYLFIDDKERCAELLSWLSNRLDPV